MTEVEIMEDYGLEPFEAQELARCETIVQAGIRSFFEVGHALMRIRDLKLYRETHATFEKYLEDRWDYSRQYGYQLIAAAEVTENVSTVGRQPDNERQVRPLTRLDPDTQRKAWIRTLENAKAMNNGRLATWVVERSIVEVLAENDDPGSVENQEDGEGEGADTESGPTEIRPRSRIEIEKFGKIQATASRLERGIAHFRRTIGGNDLLEDIFQSVQRVEDELERFRAEWF